MVVHYGFNGEVVRPNFNQAVVYPAFQREYGSLATCILSYEGSSVSSDFVGDNMLSGTAWASATTTMTFSAAAVNSGTVTIGASNGTSATYTMFSGTQAVQLSSLQFQHGGDASAAGNNFVEVVNGDFGLGSGTYNLVEASTNGAGVVTLTQFGAGASGNGKCLGDANFNNGTTVNASAFAGGTDNNEERWHIWGANVLPASGSDFSQFFNSIEIGYTDDNLTTGTFTSVMTVQSVAHADYGAASGGIVLDIPISMPIGKRFICKGQNGTGSSDKCIIAIHALKTSGYHGGYNVD